MADRLDRLERRWQASKSVRDAEALAEALDDAGLLTVDWLAKLGQAAKAREDDLTKRLDERDRLLLELLRKDRPQ